MDEEVEAQREARLEAWGRDDFSTYKPAKLAEGESEVQITKTREVIDGVTPFFREKPMDLALTEGEPLRISCLVASEPRAAMQSWERNYAHYQESTFCIQHDLRQKGRLFAALRGRRRQPR